MLGSLALVALLGGVGCVSASPTAAARPAVDSLRFGRFGTLAHYGDPKTAKHVVLFVSGDGGWTLGVVEMAKSLAAHDALVVGIDIRHYLAELEKGAEPCAYLAGDFEALGQYVQKALGRIRYDPPVLVGYSSGATLVYAALVQAPPNTFRGAMSLGFCPDLAVHRPLCPGAGLRHVPLPRGRGVDLLRVQRVSAPWIVFQGDQDQVCMPDSTRAYVEGVEGAELVWLPKVGHGFGVESRWLPQFEDRFRRLVNTATSAAASPGSERLGDLPLVEVAARPSGPGGRFAVILSGDGGWAGIDRELGEDLAKRGVPVVGLNSLQYFWQRKTPDTLAIDLARVIDHYRGRWARDSVLLIGYSLGADALAFGVDLLPARLRATISAVALIGPSGTATFEFHVGEWLGRGDEKEPPTRPAIERMRSLLGDVPILCLYGSDESDATCPSYRPNVLTSHALPGGHHLGGDYGRLSQLILEARRP